MCISLLGFLYYIINNGLCQLGGWKNFWFREKFAGCSGCATMWGKMKNCRFASAVFLGHFSIVGSKRIATTPDSPRWTVASRHPYHSRALWLARNNRAILYIVLLHHNSQFYYNLKFIFCQGFSRYQMSLCVTHSSPDEEELCKTNPCSVRKTSAFATFSVAE